ncbi:MAG: HNH endonuclease [Methylococcaceae bacterium]
MNPLQRTLIEKVGNDNGFEHVVLSEPDSVVLASARHPNRAIVSLEHGIYLVGFQTESPSLLPELHRSFPGAGQVSGAFGRGNEAELARLLNRAASLSRALPCQAVHDYQQAVAGALAQLPTSLVGTEMERWVRVRVGQDKFRQALLDYWGGACAVTGVAIPEVLRASHALAWAECATDAERLDVFNGFLLCAHLDALFDRFLISFDNQGALLVTPSLARADLRALGITPGLTLRWVNALHQPYLALHRARCGRALDPLSGHFPIVQTQNELNWAQGHPEP